MRRGEEVDFSDEEENVASESFGNGDIKSAARAVDPQDDYDSGERLEEVDIGYDEYLFPTVPEPPDTLRGLTSRDEEIKALFPRKLRKRKSTVYVDDGTSRVLDADGAGPLDEGVDDNIVVDAEGGGTSSSSSSSSSAAAKRAGNVPLPVEEDERRCSWWCRGWRNFKQQRQHGWVPVYTPKTTIIIMFVFAAIFVGIGVPSLIESQNAQEIKVRYDNVCTIETSCPVSVVLDNDKLIENINEHGKTLYLHYEIKNQYQNVRRYVDSVAWSQMRAAGKSVSNSVLDRCRPQKYITREPDASFVNDGLSLPCGLMPWSFFNDTIAVEVNGNAVTIDETNIAWEQDMDHLYSSNVVPINYNTIPAYAGGGSFSEAVGDNEHFAVWMRLGLRNQFRKLYGTIETQTQTSPPQPIFQLGDTITFNIENNYNTYNFNGEKKVVLSTLSFLGGQNDFTGIVFLALAGVFLISAVFIAAITAFRSSAPGDLNALSWVRDEYEYVDDEDEDDEDDEDEEDGPNGTKRRR